MSSPKDEIREYISLSKQEMNTILYCLAVEKVWFGRWRALVRSQKHTEHWCIRGEDAWTRVEKTVFGVKHEQTQRLIDMRDYTWQDADGVEHPIGWVPCERILPWKPGVVPTVINDFIKRWFDRELFGYQLYIYYQCQPHGLVVGGRGSAKTEGVALAAASWITLHPGQPWAHFAFTGTQAMEVYEILGNLGRDWIETFVHRRTRSPHGLIKLKAWHEHDYGNYLVIRPLGQAAEATTTRSLRVRRTSIDECTRDIANESVLAVAEASARGLNDVAIALLPPDVREEIESAKLIMDEYDKRRRRGTLSEEQEAHLHELEDLFWKYGVSCHLTSFRTGNRGPHVWVDEWLLKAETNSQQYWGAKVSYLINPHLDAITRAKLESTYTDPEQIRVELYAEKPTGMGQWFLHRTISECVSAELSLRLQEALRNNEPGWELAYYGPYVIRYARPARQKQRGVYVLGADPGTGVVPRRDSWAIMVWWLDYDENKLYLDAFAWGNTTSRNAREWQPFIEELSRLRRTYGILPQNCCIQVGGQERGILEIAWGRDFANYASVDMSATTKATMANYTRDLLTYRMLAWPVELADIAVQLSNWDFDDKLLDQDIVMAVFATAFIAYPRLLPAIRAITPSFQQAYTSREPTRYRHIGRRQARLT